MRDFAQDSKSFPKKGPVHAKLLSRKLSLLISPPASVREAEFLRVGPNMLLPRVTLRSWTTLNSLLVTLFGWLLVGCWLLWGWQNNNLSL